MDSHMMTHVTDIAETVKWLRRRGYGCAAVAPVDAAPPALLFRPLAQPNEPPKLAFVGDMLVADGPLVRIADPMEKGIRP